MTNKEWQIVYDAIKLLRLGNTVQVTIDGITYQVEPFESRNQHASGYCQNVLCKYGKRIGITTISWKDAGPNPRIDGFQAFIRFKHIYGVVKCTIFPKLTT